MALTRYPAEVWRIVNIKLDHDNTKTEARVIGVFDFARLPAIREHIALSDGVYAVQNVVHYPLAADSDTPLDIGKGGTALASIHVQREE